MSCKYNKIVFFASLVMIAFFLAGCSSKEDNQEQQLYVAEDYLLGTDIMIQIEGADAGHAGALIFTRIKEIQDKMTFHGPGSEIADLNAGAGVAWTSVSEDTFLVLQEAIALAGLTGGAFDPTVGPLVKLWGIGSGDERVPAESEIRSARSLVDYRLLQLAMRDGSGQAFLPVKGQAVDLGAIAKGYAGDEARRILIDSGISRGLLNLGGNVMAVGAKKDGSPWRVGIQNPLAPRGTYVGIVQVVDQAVVSSGGYERYFTVDGNTYHHIIDPRMGHPAESGLLSVTIITGQGVVADALSTGTYVLGLARGLELIESLDGVEAVFITEDRKVVTTRGLADKFQLTDEEFTHEKV